MIEKDDDVTYTSSHGKVPIPLHIFFKDARRVFAKDGLGLEITRIALPAAMALTADPLASLVDTAFIGQIGPIELAAVGVSIAIFNQVSKIAIFPLVSVTTSQVAEENTKTSFEVQERELPETKLLINSENERLIPQTDRVENEEKSESSGDSFDVAKPRNGKRHIPSASSALITSSILGFIQAILLICTAKPVLTFMGVKSDSPMMLPAKQYLTLRSLGAPAVLLSLAMQGIFRGIKDTKTPLYVILAADVANIILDPIFIYGFGLGVRGAAIAHIISQYLLSGLLLWRLLQQVELLPLSRNHLQFGRFLKNGFMLLMRVIAVTFCVTLAASMAAREGPTAMAAFQICLQLWLATSLLADGLAVAAQAILASAFARKDFEEAERTVSRVLQLGLVLGMVLSVFLGVVMRFGARIFTNDLDVLDLIAVGIPFVAATQPINVLAFVFDGINFGASDFAYAAYSMILVAIVSIGLLFLLSHMGGFIGIWVALTTYMTLRAFAGIYRIGTASGPWEFLRSL